MSNQGKEKELKAPEGDFEGWDNNTSNTNGVKFCSRMFDTAGTSGPTSADFANKTGITWYKSANIVGWTYQLTIATYQSYNYTFNTPVDSYGLNVWATGWTQEVPYTTFDPTVASVSGN